MMSIVDHFKIVLNEINIKINSKKTISSHQMQDMCYVRIQCANSYSNAFLRRNKHTVLNYTLGMIVVIRIMV